MKIYTLEIGDSIRYFVKLESAQKWAINQGYEEANPINIPNNSKMMFRKTKAKTEFETHFIVVFDNPVYASPDYAFIGWIETED